MIKGMEFMKPIALAGIFNNVYGKTFEPVNYVRGVPLSGQLRLARMLGNQEDTALAVKRLVDPLINDFDVNSLSLIHISEPTRRYDIW